MIKRLIILMLALLLLTGLLCSCGKEKEQTSDEPEAYPLAMISQRNKINDGKYNELTWKGITDYGDANSIACKYYTPEQSSHESHLAAIKLAVNGGAKVIVAAGYEFEESFYTAQSKYSDVKFILVDAAVHPEGSYISSPGDILSNTACLAFREEDAGFLAGYAAVADGYSNLGFMGGLCVEDERAYCYGFLQGVSFAAEEFDRSGVKVTCRYTSDYLNNSSNAHFAAAMYASGTQLIFASDRIMLSNAVSAADESGNSIIAADFNYAGESKNVITSAIKRIDISLRRVLNAAFDGDETFAVYGGKVTRMGVSDGAVALSSDLSRFKVFDAPSYTALLDCLKNGIVTPVRTIKVADLEGVASARELTEGLGLDNITVETAV